MALHTDHHAERDEYVLITLRVMGYYHVPLAYA
jgi:hypothetical protein